MTTTENLPKNNDRYVAGDTVEIEVTVTNDDGSTKDLRGADIQFALSRYAGANPLFTRTVGDGIEFVDATAGELLIRIDGDDTVDLGDDDGKEYYYEIRVRDNTGDIATVTTGTWTIYADTASF